VRGSRANRRKRPRRPVATRVAGTIGQWMPCPASLLVAGCVAAGPGAQDGPLGWRGPVEAREVRRWGERDLDEAPRWSVAKPPAHGGGVVGIGSREDEWGRDATVGVWFASADGEFERPASRVEHVGPLVGAFPDGSLVASGGFTGATDTTLISPTVWVRPVPEGTPLSRADAPKLIFETAVARDPVADYPVHFFWAHDPRRATGVAGDTVWTVPSDRPELVGVHRSGEVLLRVEWEAGDRTIPADISERVREQLRELERIPAARRLLVGTDGLVHVQRVEWRGGGPRIGPEWLVFGPTGAIVARLEIPRRLEVLAFGRGMVVARTRNADDVVEIGVHRLEKPDGA